MLGLLEFLLKKCLLGRYMSLSTPNILIEFIINNNYIFLISFLFCCHLSTWYPMIEIALISLIFFLPISYEDLSSFIFTLHISPSKSFSSCVIFHPLLWFLLYLIFFSSTKNHFPSSSTFVIFFVSTETNNEILPSLVHHYNKHTSHYLLPITHLETLLNNLLAIISALK